ncbi:MAG TPA: hypothetical protein VKZ18_23955 [Polyangia bacterium]|nr:hypothetical protein [Polyangia bacterium]
MKRIAIAAASVWGAVFFVLTAPAQAAEATPSGSRSSGSGAWAARV